MLGFVRILETFKPIKFCYFKVGVLQQFSHKNTYHYKHSNLYWSFLSITTRNNKIYRNLQFKQLPPTMSDI